MTEVVGEGGDEGRRGIHEIGETGEGEAHPVVPRRPGCGSTQIVAAQEIGLPLGESGISEYRIFLDKSTDELFAVQRVSGDHGSQDLGRDPIVQKWWKYMSDIMETNMDFSPVVIPLEEVFYLP